ncbi:MAG TPA: YceI family protein [Gaiellaceae bacterium]|jgi:polyisoprenoid-binding protein YceI
MGTVETNAAELAGTWVVDPSHSSVEFEVVDTESLVAAIRGRFTDFEGTVVLPNGDGAGKATAVIRTASVTTDNEARDAHLRSPDFLDAAVAPEITFSADRVDVDGDALTIPGSLAIRGTAFPVELKTRALGAGTDVQGREKLVLASDGELDWGAQKVTLDLSATLVKEA